MLLCLVFSLSLLCVEALQKHRRADNLPIYQSRDEPKGPIHIKQASCSIKYQRCCDALKGCGPGLFSYHVTTGSRVVFGVGLLVLFCRITCGSPCKSTALCWHCVVLAAAAQSDINLVNICQPKMILLLIDSEHIVPGSNRSEHVKIKFRCFVGPAWFVG